MLTVQGWIRKSAGRGGAHREEATGPYSRGRVRFGDIGKGNGKGRWGQVSRQSLRPTVVVSTRNQLRLNPVNTVFLFDVEQKGFYPAACGCAFWYARIILPTEKWSWATTGPRRSGKLASSLLLLKVAFAGLTLHRLMPIFFSSL